VSVLLVISGPSGVGKGTIVRRLLEREPGLWFSVSVTDRPPRPGEVAGRDYHFVSTEEFERMRDAGDLLEWFEVYGDLKGTPRAPIEERLAAGDDVLVEIDVNGALEVRRGFPEALLVFLRPPSREVQRARLLARDPTADPESLESRLAEAEAEEARAVSFDAVVVNDEVDQAVEEIRALLAARRGVPPSEGPAATL
jgi:guanylate kinase